jgi:hypothetical protein
VTVVEIVYPTASKPGYSWQEGAIPRGSDACYLAAVRRLLIHRELAMAQVERPEDETAVRKACDKQVVAIWEIPDEFMRGLLEPYYDAEQAALDYLLE